VGHHARPPTKCSDNSTLQDGTARSRTATAWCAWRRSCAR
jgi:hypothetical protein